MSAAILLLHAGDSERARIDDLAVALCQLGLTVTVEDLENGDYDRVLDAMVAADTVTYWPAESTGRGTYEKSS